MYYDTDNPTRYSYLNPRRGSIVEKVLLGIFLREGKKLILLI